MMFSQARLRCYNHKQTLIIKIEENVRDVQELQTVYHRSRAYVSQAPCPLSGHPSHSSFWELEFPMILSLCQDKSEVQSVEI